MMMTIKKNHLPPPKKTPKNKKKQLDRDLQNRPRRAGTDRGRPQENGRRRPVLRRGHNGRDGPGAARRDAGSDGGGEEIYSPFFFLDLLSLSLSIAAHSRKITPPLPKKPCTGLRPPHARLRRADEVHLAPPRPHRGPLEADGRHARQVPDPELAGGAAGDPRDGGRGFRVGPGLR